MNNFSQEDNQKAYSHFNRIKRRRINEINSLLSDWYGKELGRVETRAYFPKVLSVKDVVSKIVSHDNYLEIESLTKIQQAWREVVGPEVSANSKPLSLKNGTLTIQAKNSAWLAELKTFYAKIIENKLGTVLKNIKLKKILFVSEGK